MVYVTYWSTMWPVNKNTCLKLIMNCIIIFSYLWDYGGFRAGLWGLRLKNMDSESQTHYLSLDQSFLVLSSKQAFSTSLIVIY